MIRGLVGWCVLCGATAWGAEGPQMVALTVTIASGSDAKLSNTQDAAALVQAVTALEQQGALTHLSRIRFSALEQQQTHIQFGETTSVITGRTMMGFGGSRGPTPPGQPERGGPSSVASYQQQQTGTMVMAMVKVAEAGVVAEISIEQSRFDKSRPPADDPPVTPPEKPMMQVKSTVLIPRDGAVLLGGFETTKEGAIQRTVVLATATVTGPTVGAAAAATNQQRLKIFSLANVDGEAMRKVLDELFPKRDYSAAVDQRTNSLLLQSDEETLKVMEAIILRLDESDIRRAAR